LQTRLLRVLSDGHFYRVGGHTAIKANVRVIAATHQDLEQRVKDGAFREDLFHRLNVIRLRLPALRERREDIPTLTRHFLQQSAQQLGVEPKRIAEGAQLVLNQFAFPGNVRQLENICHWLTVMAPSQMIEVKDLPPEVQSGLPTDRLAAAGDSLMQAATAVAHAGESTFAASATPAAGAPHATSTSHASSASHAPSTSPAALASQASASAAGSALASGLATAYAQGGANTMPPPVVLNMPGADWEQGLEAEAMRLLVAGRTDVWDALVNRVEARLIQTALANTRGRRIEAAQKLGIGRNTITRKIQELGLED